MTTAAAFLKEAASHIGDYGDYNIYNKWYWVDYTKEYRNDPGTAWCAAFMSYCAFKVKLKCSYSASASAFGTQFKRIPVEREETDVRPGDIVIFNWDGRTDTGWCDHVGVVEWSTMSENGQFGTIEGNTGSGAEGCVARVVRSNWSGYFTAFYRPDYDTSAKTQPKGAVAKAVQTVKDVIAKPAKPAGKLYGIDVSSNQPASIVRDVQNDFAIVKLSGNPHGYSWDYVNGSFDQQYGDAVKLGKKPGAYHFTYGLDDPLREADFFIEQAKKHGILGKCMLVIDYEADALEKGRGWVKKFADRVKSKAGYSPVIYASGSVIVAQKLGDLGYPLWCANYYRGYEAIDGYDTSGMNIYPGCDASILWQFTSQGYLKGYDGPLDMDVFFGSGSDWDGYCSGKTASKSGNKVSSDYKSGTYEVKVDGVAARKQRTVTAASVAKFKKGKRFRLVTLMENKYGNVWGRIEGGVYSGRYICVRYNGKERCKYVGK